MISIIIPVFDEEESLPSFYKELILFLKSSNWDYEIIFVDDGSVDKSLSILKDIAQKDKKVKVYSFRRNQGKSEALTLGFQKAKGDYIATLDADLQDIPSEINNLFNKLKEGFDVVSGWRKNRKDKSYMVNISRIFNIVVGKLFDLKIHDYNCGLKVYTKEAAKSLNLYGGLHRFIPLLAFEQGFSVSEVIVQHNQRRFGRSKYKFSKLWKDLPDIFTIIFLTKYGKRPLHFFGIAGFSLFFLGFIILVYLVILKIIGQGIGERPILFLGMILVLTGFQTFLTGFLADLIINVSDKKVKEYSLKFFKE